MGPGEQTVTSLPGGHIGEQHTAYRRGLVLGLTMAEVGILIIFVLLLLLALGALRLGKTKEVIKTFQGKEAVETSRLQALEEAEKRLAEIAREVGGDNRTPEEIQSLVRVVREAAAAGTAKSDLAAAREELRKLDLARRGLEAAAKTAAGASDGTVLAGQIEAQAKELANRTGQLEYTERRLRQLGVGGRGERPCWVEPDGSIVFVYDVALTNQGIRMRERSVIAGREFPVGAPRPSVSADEVLSQGEFLARTKALYDYGRSDERRCRFFVRVYDQTDATEKPLYKALLATVEDHFYKLLVPDRVAF